MANKTIKTTSSPTIAQLSKAAARPNAKKPIIEIDKVTKSFRVGKNTIDVLKNINIKIYLEEFIIILGPSGSGKSTLLNILLGLEPPSSGRVVLHGSTITGLKLDKISKIRANVYGIVFQKADWLRSLNVVQNVALPLAISNVKRKERLAQAWKRLKEVGMDDHALYTPRNFPVDSSRKFPWRARLSKTRQLSLLTSRLAILILHPPIVSCSNSRT